MLYDAAMQLDTLIKRGITIRMIAKALGLTTQAVWLWRKRGSVPELREFQLRSKRPSWFTKRKDNK